MKTVVLITGTNAVGKSSLAEAIIRHYGGIERIANDVTYCNTKGVCLAGEYGLTKYGGVDRIKNEKGCSCTSRLAEVVEEGLRNSDLIFCEGMYLNTFGMNLSNALFKGDRQLVVNLFCEPAEIYRRIIKRSSSKNGDGIRNWKTIFKKQEQSMLSARKWQQIGIPVLQMNTAVLHTEELLKVIVEKLDSICG